MSSWNFTSIKKRIETIADLSRSGVNADAEARYFKGLDTELKAVRAWVDIDKEERAQSEIIELREIVASLQNTVAELHASGGNARAPSAIRESPPIKWET